jgi:hypothetical protein
MTGLAPDGLTSSTTAFTLLEPISIPAYRPDSAARVRPPAIRNRGAAASPSAAPQRTPILTLMAASWDFHHDILFPECGKHLVPSEKTIAPALTAHLG